MRVRFMVPAGYDESIDSPFVKPRAANPQTAESDAAGERNQGALAAVVLHIAILAGAALALRALPYLFQRLPNDLDRFRVIIAALSSMRPEIVVLGDSRGAAGVDARQLARDLGGSPLALNLSSHGQGLADTLLLMEQMPPTVRTIVFIVGRDRLVFDSQFNAVAYNALFMYGYRPDAEIREAIATAYGAEAIRVIDRPSIAQIASARWAPQQTIDMLLYGAVRGSARRTRERDDLYFPSIYSQRLDEKRFAAALSVTVHDMSAAMTMIPPNNRGLIEAMARIAVRRHQRILIVSPPLLPILDTPANKAYEASLRSLAAAVRLEFFDATTLFADDDFADPLHLTQQGARKLTTAIARRIQEME